MKKLIILLAGFLLLLNIGIATAFTVDGSTELQMFDIDNISYIINTSMDFSRINHSDNNPTDITFNSTINFNVSAPNPTNITLMHLDSQLISFYANTTIGNVYFNISGLQINTQYRVKRNETTLITQTTDNIGTISFNNDAWSQRYFEIYQYNEAEDEQPKDNNIPKEPFESGEISNELLLLMALILIILIIAIFVIFF